MTAWSSLLNLEPETWDLDHRRNLHCLFIAAQAVARTMIARGTAGPTGMDYAEAR